MNFPTSPIGQHNRLMLAFNDSLRTGDRNYLAPKAVVEISRQTRAIAASGTVATRTSPEPQEGLGHSASVNYRKEEAMQNIATLIEDRNTPGQYRVEAEDEDGGMEVAVFAGPNALDRAIIFAGCDYYDEWNDPQALAGH